MPDACSERMTAWLSHQTAKFEGLSGRVVERWRGVEMALREGGSNGAQFSDPGIPCLQLLHLEATLDDAERRTIDTYQDNDRFGLRVTASTRSHGQEWAGIYRESELDLPVGRVDAVTAKLEAGTLAEVVLSIGGTTLLLIAAEIYELDNRLLEWHRLDESVLLFTDTTAADEIEWIPARVAFDG